ncbi:MAG TPA: PilZ domain-containing protein [Candidatus Eisenbacteria bacterium]|nr:PilZ domain-containing protein [Candidatus Eisenbacteria bacterium]
MAQYINEGVAYLMALKQGGQAGNVGSGQQVPEAQPGTPADEDNRFHGAEKRRSLRYKCEGSVELKEKNCDVHTWATFTDVSIHGCYVEAQATYPPGTVLHLKLDANSIRVETQAIVRVTYPYLGMGISFEGMSDENRASLLRLLSMLSHRSVAIGAGSASSASGALKEIPDVTDPAAAMGALVEFFGSRQALLREEFVRIVKKSQEKR